MWRKKLSIAVLLLAVCMMVATGSLVVKASALTAGEVELLKQSGVEDTIILLMIEQSRPGVSIREDETGKRSILYSTGTSQRARTLSDEEAEKVERAWEMLRHVIIDARPQ